MYGNGHVVLMSRVVRMAGRKGDFGGACAARQFKREDVTGHSSSFRGTHYSRRTQTFRTVVQPNGDSPLPRDQLLHIENHFAAVYHAKCARKSIGARSRRRSW